MKKGVKTVYAEGSTQWAMYVSAQKPTLLL